MYNLGIRGKGMIVGVGTDIIEIERIRRAIDGGVFLTRYFSENENEYFSKLSNKAQSVACSFAAKEAFAKTLGTGIRGFVLKEVEILHDEMGKPYISLLGDAKKVAASKGIKRFHVSLSHCREYAIAYVVAEK
ncbi:MAG: holo-ACP synthase [Clostridia bacterium]|nr:holo-ACP synthase [Clostridia bacterium]